MTVGRVLKKFVAGNFQMSVFEKRSKRFLFLSDNLKRILADKATLQLWAPFGIAERCEIIKRVYNENIGRTSLQRFYAMHNITYQTSK